VFSSGDFHSSLAVVRKLVRSSNYKHTCFVCGVEYWKSIEY
jgi:hypothetical protein